MFKHSPADRLVYRRQHYLQPTEPIILDLRPKRISENLEGFRNAEMLRIHDRNVGPN